MPANIACETLEDEVALNEQFYVRYGESTITYPVEHGKSMVSLLPSQRYGKGDFDLG